MNILIVKTSAIGDVTHTLPALNILRENFPNAHISWLIEEAASDIILDHPALDRVLISRRKKWIQSLIKGPNRLNAIKSIYYFVKLLRDTQYDLLIDFQSLLKSGVLIGLTKAKRKVGFGKGMDHSEYSYLFLNERVPAVKMDNHAINRELLLLEAIGIKGNRIEFNMPIQPESRKSVNELLESHSISYSQKIVSINPQAKWDTKLWDSEKFSIVADWIAEQGFKIVFTGSAEDADLNDLIINMMKYQAINLSGKTSLKMLAALFARSTFIVSTDTGPMHIGASVHTPVIAIFGPTAPWRTGPYGEIHKVIRTELDCSPCYKRTCSTMECMKSISSQQVIQEIQKILL